MIEKLVKYVKRTYGVEAEHPWKKYPEHTTFKAKENSKWFALVMSVSKRSLGLKSDGDIDIINVKAEPEFISLISSEEGYMPAYHMNKQNWLTIFLDGSVDEKAIIDCIDRSYQLVTDSPTKRIYEAVRKIPRGKVATYGQVAEMAGNPKMSRAVGNALHKNPDPDGIPCYRVVNSKGELAGAFAFGGGEVQAELLRADGIEVVGNKVDLGKFGM